MLTGLCCAILRFLSESKHPYIGFFPALPVANNLDLGEWLVGTPPAEVTWRSPRFKELSETLFASFAKVGFGERSLLWHRDRGFDGQLPPDNIIRAIQAGVRFAVLDANDDVRGDPNAGYYLATTENAELYLQPIDEEDGGITHRRGGLLRNVLTGGLKIGQEPLPLPDAVLKIDRPVRASSKLARAVFDALAVSGSAEKRRVNIALEWYFAALVNPRAVTLQQRLIMLKTGFEALVGEGMSNSRDDARRLRALFEGVTLPHRALLPWPGILWSPKERTDLQRTYVSRSGRTRIDTRSELEDWFMTLAEARNSIIHDGELSVVEYGPPSERPLSRYKGQLFWTGERLLRDAIKAALGAEVLLCGALADAAMGQQLMEMLREEAARDSAQPAFDENQADESHDSALMGDEVEAPRTLEALLAELGCQAANEIEMTQVVGRGNSDDAWSAKAGERSLLISSAEREILEAAGAEDALPHYFRRCD